MSIESKLKRTSVQLEFRYYSRQKFSSTFKRAILQAHATKFVPSSKVEAFRETVKKVSCSTSSASANEGCKALTNARIEFSCRTNSNCTSSVALGDPRWSSEVFITRNVRGDGIVSEKTRKQFVLWEDHTQENGVRPLFNLMYGV